MSSESKSSIHRCRTFQSSYGGKMFVRTHFTMEKIIPQNSTDFPPKQKHHLFSLEKLPMVFHDDTETLKKQCRSV